MTATVFVLVVPPYHISTIMGQLLFNTSFCLKLKIINLMFLFFFFFMMIIDCSAVSAHRLLSSECLTQKFDKEQWRL